jgi:hypothetical protein
VTPDVSGGSYFVTSANTGATAITDLDNPVVGATYVICGGSDTNSSTIGDSGNFNLSSAFTASLDSCIALKCQADNDYVELSRNSGGGWTSTATSALDMATYAINFGTDPADTGDVNLENNTSICTEASPAGTDACMKIDSEEDLAFSGVNQILAPDGTSAAPGITFSGAEDSGMYLISVTPDRVGFATNGIPVFRLDTDSTAYAIDLIDGGTRPACSSTYRGWLFIDEGGAGVADTLAICNKDAADAYGWRSLF